MYFEHKFRIERADLARVRAILTAQFGGSDPYPEGMVDTVYYDTEAFELYALCARREPQRIKFRARGYRDGELTQLQIKVKRDAGQHKLKARLRGARRATELGPWDELVNGVEGREARAALAGVSAPWGRLHPCLRVRYERARFRVFDQRVTLDTNVRFDAVPGAFTSRRPSARLLDGVLEIKSHQPEVHVPLLGLVQLAPRTLTKFREGVAALELAMEGGDGGDLWSHRWSRDDARTDLAR